MRTPLRAIAWSEHAHHAYVSRQRTLRATQSTVRSSPEESILRAVRDSLSAPTARTARLQNAFDTGKYDGSANKHHGRNLDGATGPEILAWLEGWRQGQAEFKVRQAEIARLREEISRL